MNYLWQGFLEAGFRILSFDAAIMDAAFRSLWISGLAVTLAVATGLPVALMLAHVRFPGRRLLVEALRVGMALPTVFVGIVCFAFFSRQGPLSGLELLYTPWAIVAGEFLLAFPIVVSLSIGAFRSLDSRVRETAYMLGARGFQLGATLVSEARTGVTLAILTAFARCVTELGIAMMVGGNLAFRTRTLATATALETSKGEFVQGLAMGLILLFIALVMTVGMGLLSRENGGEDD